MDSTMQAGAKGIKIQVSGRLGGAEIARQEKSGMGSVPLTTLQANVDYGYAIAFTTFGTIGVKTGFTDAAGHCLIAAVKHHGTTLVAILLDSPDTGPQAKKLLEKGFDEVKDRK